MFNRWKKISNYLRDENVVLLDSSEFSVAVLESIQDVQSTMLLASAFIKKGAFETVLSELNDNVTVSIVARWQARDLLANASDMEVYKICRQRGYRFGVSLNFHGKVYIFDRGKILLGSANLTSRGFSLAIEGNLEFGTQMLPRVSDLEKIDRFLGEEVIWLDDALFESMEADLLSMKKEPVMTLNEANWSGSLLSKLAKPVNYLWMEELLFCTPTELLKPDFNDKNIVHDMDLLALSIDDLSCDAIELAFRRSRFYKWLTHVISVAGRINFGGLSAALHNGLLDDPALYRRDVKSYIQLAFTWMEKQPDTFDIQQHRVTRSVSLVSSNEVK